MISLKEATTINDKTRELLLRVKQAIHQMLPDAQVLLYGSVARGTNGPDSDIDILVLTEKPVDALTKEKIDDAIYDLELETGELIPLSFTPMETWKKFPQMLFHEEIKRDGIVL